MSIKAFFVDALTSALELGIGTPEDVLRHATPEVLAAHLPRPLWARLFTACLGASRVDAGLVVDTIGIANLCEHLPWTTTWSVIADIGARALGRPPNGVIAPPPEERPAPVAQPAPAPVGPALPPLAAAPSESLADVISELDSADPAEPRLATLRPRSPTAQRFRQSNTAAARLGSARRPQAAIPTPAATPSSQTLSSTRRGETEAEPEQETMVGGGGNWGTREVVDDSQLVDWSASATSDGAAAPMTDEDFSDLGRKR